MKRLYLNKNHIFNDSVDNFICTVNISENISRLYLQDRLGYTQIRFHKFDKKDGEICFNKIDPAGFLWTLLKQPAKESSEKDKGSTRYSLIRNGDMGTKGEFELPHLCQTKELTSDKPFKLFPLDTQSEVKQFILLTLNGHVYKLQ